MKERGALDPGETLLAGVRVRLDKEISLEAAKLLGVPVTWGACRAAFRYVRTSEGLRCEHRAIVNGSRMLRGTSWSVDQGDAYLAESARYHILHPVEIDEEAEIN